VTPRELYARRRDAARGRSQRLRPLEGALSHARLAVFAAAAAAAWLAFGLHWIARGWLLPLAVVFVALMVIHDRVIRRREREDRRAAWYERGLARLDDTWAGGGETGRELAPDEHPYAEDLDLFGEGSLFDLLCTARTPLGAGRLAAWLLQPSDAGTVRARQAAVAELAPRADLREDLALLGDDVRARLAPEALLAWGAAPARRPAAALRIACGAAAAAAVLALGGWALAGTGPLPFAGALAVEAALAISLHRRVAPEIRDVERPLRDLRLLSGLLARVEREEVSSPLLAARRRALERDGRPPSEEIARLQRLADLLDARRNQFFVPIGALLLWGTQVGLAVQDWRARCGPALASWVDAAAEWEALAALSAYAYEHPEDAVPDIEEGPPRFEARDLGHPLLPRATCVRNDITLGDAQRGWIVSGSNMSGKSTWLRTVGTNTVLALAGAPVRASSLRLSPLQVAASIHVHDSLQAGVSRFYAEIRRLHRIVELSGERPVLFLLDEILHGTNSHDRRIGAEAVVRELLERGALGLVTTHDLALARIADEDGDPRLANVHFEDHLEDGHMRFDYRLRPGVVRRSNALELMRAVGLEV